MESLVNAGLATPPKRPLDAIHLASALRVGTENVTLATHDSNMRKVAELLGFAVHDPVTD